MLMNVQGSLLALCYGFYLRSQQIFLPRPDVIAGDIYCRQRRCLLTMFRPFVVVSHNI